MKTAATSVPRGAKCERICKCCGAKFMARVADVKRGWAKFCSKSCKATKQEQRTGQYARHQAGAAGEWAHPFDYDGHGQWGPE